MTKYLICGADGKESLRIRFTVYQGWLEQLQKAGEKNLPTYIFLFFCYLVTEN